MIFVTISIKKKREPSKISKRAVIYYVLSMFHRKTNCNFEMTGSIFWPSKTSCTGKALVHLFLFFFLMESNF